MITVCLFEFLLRLMPLLCQWTRLFDSLLVGILSGSEGACTTLGTFCVRPVLLPPQVSLGKVDRLVKGFLMAAVAVIVY